MVHSLDEVEGWGDGAVRIYGSGMAPVVIIGQKIAVVRDNVLPRFVVALQGAEVFEEVSQCPDRLS